MNGIRPSRRCAMGLLGGTAFAPSFRSCRLRAADTADVIIIGAGLAGLTAASWLEEEGFSTSIVEAKNRIGGRCYTMTDLPGKPEAGGSSVGPMYARFIDFCDRLDVKRSPAKSSGFGGHIHLKGTNILNEDWADHSLNPFEGDERELTPAAFRFGLIDKFKLFDDLESWWEPSITASDTSILNFMRSKGFSDAALRLGMDTNPGYGHTIDDLSVVHMMQVWNFARMQITADPPTFWNVEGGNSSLVNAMAASLKAAIHLSTPVSGIRAGGSGVDCTPGGAMLRVFRVRD